MEPKRPPDGSRPGRRNVSPAHRPGKARFDMTSALQQAAPVTAVDLPTLRHRSMIFSALSEQVCLELLQLARVVVVPARKAVCQAGEPGDALYVVLHGRAKVSLVSEEGKEIILSFLDAGQVFGEMSLLDGQPRSATVTTMEESRLLILWRKDVLPYLEAHPAIAIKLLAALSQKLRKTNGLIEDLHFLNLPARLARVLISLADQYGVDTPEGREIRLKLSQEEMGNLVGSSRESINKQLRAWTDQGLLDTQQGVLLVKRLDALQEIVNSPG